MQKPCIRQNKCRYTVPLLLESDLTFGMRSLCEDYFKDRSAGRAILMRDKLKKENVKKWCKIALKM